MSVPLPTDIYLDTSVIVAAIIGGDPHSPICIAFCDDLAARNAAVYFSQILHVEVAQAVRRIATRGAAPAHLHRQYQLEQFSANLMIREAWLRYGMSQLDQRLRTFAVRYELPLAKRIWQRAVLLMATHNLDALDAVHAATALRYHISDFASSDGHFQRVFGTRFHHVV